MRTGHAVNIIRIFLLFLILLTGIISIIVNERKKTLQARRRNYEALAANLGKDFGSVSASTKPLRSPEINCMAAIIALKGGVRSLAFVLASLSLLLILIECYRMFGRH